MAGERRATHRSLMPALLEQPSPAPPSPELRPSSRAAERLYAARTVLVFGEIDMALAARASAELLALASESREPIRVIVNSPGGHVESADTLHDLIRFIAAPVTMIGTGWVASAGALIYAAARRERRLSLPNTRFLLHQPSGGVGGPASDVEIEARQMLAMRSRLNRLFAEATGQPLEKIAKDTERNHWMSAEEATAYGLVGRIVESAGDADAGRA